MPYVFPRRYPRTGDTFDADDFVQDVSRPAELLAGGINETNIAKITGGFDATDDAFLSFDVINTTVEFDFYAVGAPPHNPPPETRAELEALTGVVVVPNTYQWEVVEAFDPFDSAFEQIIVTANCQYVWAGFEPTGAEPRHAFACTMVAFRDASGIDRYKLDRAPRFQLGLRVDGEVICCSGIFDTSWTDVTGIRPTSTVQDATTRFPGLMSIKAAQSMAPGQPMMTVALEAQVDIAPGRHIVEIVCRRFGGVTPKTFVTNDCVGILSRTALLTRLHNESIRERSSLVSVPLAGLAPGDRMAQDDLFDDNAEALETALNSITVDSLTDFALVRHHLSPPVPKSSSTPMYGYEAWSGSAVTIQNPLISETSTTVELVNLTGSTGWTALQDGAGSVIYCTPSVGVFFPTATYAGVLEIRARVQVDKVRRTTVDEDAVGSLHHMAGLAIGYTLFSGTSTVIQNSARFFSRAATFYKGDDPTYFQGADEVGGLVDDELDVSLFAVLDLRTVPLASGITKFFVVGATLNYVDSASVDLQYTDVTIAVTFARGG